MIISVWGVIMLGLLGAFFYMRSPSLFEDAGVDEKEWKANNYTMEFVKEKYEDTALNCWIAAGLYAVLFIFSFIQQKMNSRGSYEMS